MHISSVHQGVKPFKCETCGNIFNQRSHLKFQIDSVHEGIHKTIQVWNLWYKMCEQIRNKETLWVRSSEKEISFVQWMLCILVSNWNHIWFANCFCSWEEETLWMENLWILASMHRNNRPYQCLQCDTNFTWKSHLNEHISAIREVKNNLRISTEEMCK